MWFFKNCEWYPTCKLISLPASYMLAEDTRILGHRQRTLFRYSTNSISFTFVQVVVALQLPWGQHRREPGRYCAHCGTASQLTSQLREAQSSIICCKQICLTFTSVGDIIFIILASNQYSALEGDTISIFQGCLLNKYPLEHSSEQRPLVPLLTRYAEIQKLMGELSPNMVYLEGHDQH